MQLRAILISEENMDTIAETRAANALEIEEMKNGLATHGYVYYFIPNVVDGSDREGLWSMVPEELFQVNFKYDADKIKTQFVDIEQV